MSKASWVALIIIIMTISLEFYGQSVILQPAFSSAVELFLKLVDNMKMFQLCLYKKATDTEPSGQSKDSLLCA